MRHTFCLTLCLCTIILFGCNSDTTSEYANFRAFFRFQPVTSATVLLNALNNPGTHCKITFTSQYYIFEDAHGTQSQANRLAQDVYGSPVYISGFIAGLSNDIDNYGHFMLQIYDLACPNCYADAAIQRQLTFNTSDSQLLLCGRCNRTYDLRTDGSVISGNKGRPLFKYKGSYSNDTFVVNN